MSDHMTSETLQSIFIEELTTIAPDADLTGIEDDADLRETLDLDSMDMMNLLIALHARLGINIPDRDVGELTTLGGALAYLEGRG